jgi:hypothetical protein
MDVQDYRRFFADEVAAVANRSMNGSRRLW